MPNAGPVPGKGIRRLGHCLACQMRLAVQSVLGEPQSMGWEGVAGRRRAAGP